MAKVQNQKSQVVSSKEMNEMDYLKKFCLYLKILKVLQEKHMI